MNTELERRHVVAMVEVRDEGEDAGPVITGVAAVTNQWSQDLGGFRERIAPGAFKPALRGSDIRALYNHNPDHILGRQSAGSLTVRETKQGLEYETHPVDTAIARDVVANIRAGNVTGNSFAFIVEEDTWEEGEHGLAERTIVKFKEVLDVGPVTFPAYEQTTVSVRCREQVQQLRPLVVTVEDAALRRHEALGVAIREDL